MIFVKTPSMPTSSAGMPFARAASAPAAAGFSMLFISIAMTWPAKIVTAAEAPVIICPTFERIFFIVSFIIHSCFAFGKQLEGGKKGKTVVEFERLEGYPSG